MRSLTNKELPMHARTSRWLLVLLVLAVGLNGCGESAEQKQVRSSFDAYVSAVKNQDGDTAAQYVGSSTFASA